jgi:hypothetical protein
MGRHNENQVQPAGKKKVQKLSMEGVAAPGVGRRIVKNSGQGVNPRPYFFAQNGG